MSTTLAIPMNEETRIALEDCLIDTPNMDARKFVFTNIKSACQDAKRSIRNRVTPVNQRQMEDGIVKPIQFPLKGIDLNKYTLPSDPNWLPENLDAEDSRPIELKLGDNTMGYIKNYGQLVGVRHEEFNKAEEEFLEKTRAEMMSQNAPKKNMEDWEKAQENIRKDRLTILFKTPLYVCTQVKLESIICSRLS